eukprot:5469671-Alexandrium_andersonii.AAC.1
MSASLVGSEMCIRDRGILSATIGNQALTETCGTSGVQGGGLNNHIYTTTCLLYTSDAADDM